MAIVRFDPPKRPKKDFLEVARTFIGFRGAPIETILGFATEKASGGSGRGDPVFMTVPVEVNTETGKVAVEHVEHFKGKLAILDKVRNDARPGIQRLLQTVYETGVVPDSIPPAYRLVAEEIAKLPHEEVAFYNWPKVDQVVEPEQSPEQPIERDNYMGGYLPPGGLAGFSQMMPASKLALTRGMRSAGKRRKARKTKTKRTKRAKRRSSKRKLVKGSAAAKRFMANLRKRRK